MSFTTRRGSSETSSYLSLPISISIASEVNPLTIAREYAQHCFLSEFYKFKNSDRLLFKGGTALRLIFQSPRYSEDLDFTGINNITYFEIEDLLIDTIRNLAVWGFEIEITEAKKLLAVIWLKWIFLFQDLNYR